MGLKIAISGKGGVGKTTLTSLLAAHYASRGRQVLAIDADPSPCLGPALGFSEAQLLDLLPISEMSELIAERTGSDPRASGGVFKMNPRVADIPERFAAQRDNIRLLLLGAVQQGGSGCICPASALLKQLVRHTLLERDEVVLLDLYAGVEHLGRGTAEAVDVMLAVAEPTNRSLRTVRQVQVLARDIGIEKLLLVGNKAAGAEDRAFFAGAEVNMPLAGCLEMTTAAMAADRSGVPLYDLSPELAREVALIAEAIERLARPGAPA
ncbi:cobyrinic acid ac-diamide synthase [Azotobacter chroococcum subsp. isscasi]|uniref:ATP-binding protein n=1 Tax=Azotobacter chroococcum TaxID=353 RepID=UPI001039E84D|nr:AAA family ATPase [Azotobacter chroococcum]TBW12814.1 cobyrinic acid ac-diamide synthase [Azotobacter chroococcum subsp. isscasi]